jgi:concanavalin A-like lectin/glucanase superfamily protein
MKKLLFLLLLLSNFSFGAIQFTGSVSTVVFGDLNEFDGAQKFTIMFWVNYENASTFYASMITKVNSTLTDGWGILRNSQESNLFFFVRSGSSTPFANTTNNNFKPSLWHHVTMLYDGSGAANADRLKCRLNNVSENLSYTGTVPAASGASVEALTLGALSTDSTPQSILGLMDDVVIVNRILSAAEISQHFLSKRRFLVHKPDVYWQLNDIAGGTSYQFLRVMDYSGNNKNGIASNCIAVAETRLTSP